MSQSSDIGDIDIEDGAGAQTQMADRILSQLQGLVKSAVGEIEQAKSGAKAATEPGISDMMLPLGHEFSLEMHLEHIERRYIEAALDHTNGHILKASSLLGMTYRHLRYRIGKLGIATRGRRTAAKVEHVRDIPSLLMWLLDYELNSAARHRSAVALLMVTSGSGHVSVRDFLAANVRKSDAFFSVDGGGALLMGKTKFDGAMEAVDRYRELCGGKTDLRFGLACYPRDGRTPTDIVDIAMRRVGVAKSLDFGALVSDG